MEENKIIIYTDGSTVNNGSNAAGCGWACKLMYNGKVKTKSGGMIGKTSNYMEMYAVLRALESITDKTIPVVIYSDSRYVTETINGYYKIKTHWELWSRIFTVIGEFKDVRVKWVKGHGGNRHNNEVDRMAQEQAHKYKKKSRKKGAKRRK